MQAIQNRHSDLVMVAAHRGLHAIWGSTVYPDTPENSLQSIYNAVTQGVEIIELDIRLTQDGVPILSHDSTWGRNTNVGNNYGSCCFNPWGYAPPGLTVPDGDPGELGGGADVASDPQAYRNPNVNGWSLDSVQSNNGGILLRNSLNFSWSPWAEHPPTLQQALSYIASNRWAVVLALDIKDNTSMSSAWQVVARNEDYNGTLYAYSTFFKFDAAWVFPTYSDFQSAYSSHVVNPIYDDYNYMNIMPVFQTSGIAPNLYGSESNELSADIDYLRQPYTVGTEVNLKQNPGILSTLYNEGYSGATQKALGNFNPYAEWINPNDPSQSYQFYYSNGYCCAQLSQYFYNGAPNNQPSDTMDQRYDWNFILANQNGFNIITTDNPLAMGYYLWERGQRNTSYFY
jgi:glycerophosphoryl diester phosphodiesterase